MHYDLMALVNRLGVCVFVSYLMKCDKYSFEIQFWNLFYWLTNEVTKEVTDYMEPIPCWEANDSSPSQEIPWI